MHRSTRSVAWGLIALLAGCGSSSKQPEPPSVIIRANTRVLDAAGRSLVSSFDMTTGSLVFSGTTPQLAALKAGDLLASEPTAAAPYGFLRKVISVTPQGGGLSLTTTPGSLREAIVQGDLASEGRLSPTDLTSFEARAPGILPSVAPAAIGFTAPISVVLFDGDGNPSTTGDQLRLSGSASFDIGYKVAMGWKAAYDPPFDVDVSTKFVAILYFNQTNSLGFEAGKVVVPIQQKELGTWKFAPITFFVGPVPVVLVPRITVSVDALGHADAALSFGAEEGLTIEAGVSKDYGHGFQPVFGVTPTGSASGPSLTPSFPPPGFAVNGGVKARGSLRLYGLVGPYAELRASTILTGGIGVAPPWRVRGGIGGRVGVEVDLVFWDYDWSEDIYETTWDIAQASGNTAPIISSVSPKQGTTVQLGQPVDLHAVAGDVEDGWFCCTRTWTSSKEGAIGPQPSSGLKHTFQVPGTHTLTVIATDSGGAQANASTTIQVVNTPPVVSLVKPKAGGTWYRGVPMYLQGWATDGNQPCSTLSLAWSSSLGDSLPPASCTGPALATFGTNGTRTLTLTAVDSQQASDAKSAALTIVDPPGNIPPDVTILEPVPGASIADYQGFTVKAIILDPDNPTLTYNLSVVNALGAKQIAAGIVPGNATAGTPLTVSAPAAGNLLCTGANTLVLGVADGTGGHVVQQSVDVTCTIVPK